MFLVNELIWRKSDVQVRGRATWLCHLGACRITVTSCYLAVESSVRGVFEPVTKLALSKFCASVGIFFDRSLVVTWLPGSSQQCSPKTILSV
jgi:hypothetical protein